MAFQMPLTIKRTLEHVQRHDFVLPSIQREFVWDPEQICRLFDSLMQGYPIGSFLFWKIEKAHVRDFKFYDFVLHYHERDNRHCPILELTGESPVTAILDGQQRLTALNIGLRGSHAEKEPRKWRNNPDAFPAKKLYLNVLSFAPENDLGMNYDFRFLTDEQAEERDETQHWFEVRRILSMEAGPAMFNYVLQNRLSDKKEPFEMLDRLHRIVSVDGLIAYYSEEEQDIDKVLNIFIRTNSGGTELSYSDLLLSIATAQWDELDARKEIHELVDELNDVRVGFAFSKDFVLKAGLMLCDIASVGFKVVNFNTANMAILQKNWKQIAGALKLAVRLIASFGFSGQTLTAASALLPIAYYLYAAKRSDGFLVQSGFEGDRQQIKGWLIRSLLKAGVWGSGLDSTLTAIRTVIQESDKSQFPVNEIEQVMAKRGRSLRFNAPEIEDLADLAYGDKRTFAALALLFPFVDLRNEFHVDHVFPHSQFTRTRLIKAGIAPIDTDALAEAANRLGNLQLLEGPFNVSKNDTMPTDWLKERYSSTDAQKDYRQRHLLGDVPETMSGFIGFYEARRRTLIERLTQMLAV